MTKNRQAVGRWGEDVAAAYLAGKGYEILARNLRTPYGELDLITRQGEALVFVEVKTRTSRTFGFPEEAVTAAKQRHLLESAQSYLQENPEWEGEWRIDVIAIERLDPRQPPEITHFENAIL